MTRTRLEVAHVRVEGGSCRHRHRGYHLSCDSYEALVLRSGGCCEICRTPGPRTSHGHLVIDHDTGLGDWAVRGLLCSRCNTMLDSHVHVLDQDAVARYVAAPWYRHMLAQRGISPELPPEPPVGSAVRLRWGIVMRRAETGWELEFGSGPSGNSRRIRYRTWKGFYRQYGPHHMEVIEAMEYSRETVRRIAQAGKAAK